MDIATNYKYFSLLPYLVTISNLDNNIVTSFGCITPFHFAHMSISRTLKKLSLQQTTPSLTLDCTSFLIPKCLMELKILVPIKSLSLPSISMSEQILLNIWPFIFSHPCHKLIFQPSRFSLKPNRSWKNHLDDERTWVSYIPHEHGISKEFFLLVQSFALE